MTAAVYHPAMRIAVPTLCVLAGCAGPDSAPEETDGEPPCEEGAVLDGDRCLPSACGVGPWGDLDTDGDALFVDDDAQAGGDGSREAPYRSVTEALENASGQGGRILVADGEYEEVLEIAGVDDLEIEGRCSDLVLVDGSDGGEYDPVLHVRPGGGGFVSASGLTLRNGVYTGLYVASGHFDGSDLRIEDAAGTGVYLEGGETELQDCAIVATAEYDGGSGIGVYVASRAEVELERCTVEDSAAYGVYVEGMARLVDTDVTRSVKSGLLVEDGGSITVEGGTVGGRTGSRLDFGAYVADDSAFTAMGTTFSEVANAAVYVQGEANDPALRPTVGLQGVRIEDVVPGAAGVGGIVVGYGTLDLRDSTVSRATSYGVLVGPGATATIASTVVEHTVAGDPADGGAGLQVEQGGACVVEGGTFRGNYRAGVTVSEGTLTMTACEIRESVGDDDDPTGVGISAQSGATLVVTGTTLADLPLLGIDVQGAETRVWLTDVVVSGITSVPEEHWPDYGTYGAGIRVVEGAAVIEGTRVEGVEGFGLMVRKGGACDVADSDLLGMLPDQSGAYGRSVQVDGGATLTMRDTRIERSSGVGLWVSEEGSAADLERVTVADGHPVETLREDGSGLAATRGARLTARDVTLRNVHSSAVVVDTAGSFEAIGLTVDGVRRKPRYSLASGLVIQRDALAWVQDATLTGIDGVGAYVVLGAELDCDRCVIEGAQFAGVAVLDGTARIRDSDLVGNGSLETGGGAGIYVERDDGEAVLELEGSLVEGQAHAGVWLQGNGAYRLVGNTLVGGEGIPLRDDLRVHGNAIYAGGGIAPSDGIQGLWIDGNELLDSAGGAVFLDASSASFGANTFSGNENDVIQQRCDGVASPPPGRDAGPSDAICEGARLTDPLDVSIVLEEAETLPE